MPTSSNFAIVSDIVEGARAETCDARLGSPMPAGRPLLGPTQTLELPPFPDYGASGCCCRECRDLAGYAPRGSRKSQRQRRWICARHDHPLYGSHRAFHGHSVRSNWAAPVRHLMPALFSAGRGGCRRRGSRPSGAPLLCRKKEGELRTQLPISPRRVGGHHIVVSGELGVDGLATDLEHASEATADGHGPAVVTIGFPVRRDDGRGCQIPALGEGCS